VKLKAWSALSQLMFKEGEMELVKITKREWHFMRIRIHAAMIILPGCCFCYFCNQHLCLLKISGKKRGFTHHFRILSSTRFFLMWHGTARMQNLIKEAIFTITGK
jgi:hypothetical protein